MRLTTLLDSNTEFDRLMSGLLPCRVQDPELWFAEQASGVERAKALCQQCPVRIQCLDGALDRGEPWGVWGGQVLVDGRVVAAKRGRGRPRKDVLNANANANANGIGDSDVNADADDNVNADGDFPYAI